MDTLLMELDRIRESFAHANASHNEITASREYHASQCGSRTMRTWRGCTLNGSTRGENRHQGQGAITLGRQRRACGSFLLHINTRIEYKNQKQKLQK